MWLRCATNWAYSHFLKWTQSSQITGFLGEANGCAVEPHHNSQGWKPKFTLSVDKYILRKRLEEYRTEPYVPSLFSYINQGSLFSLPEDHQVKQWSEGWKEAESVTLTEAWGMEIK